MAPQVNYGPPQNSGRKVIDNTDASAGKPTSLSAGKVPIPRELFTSQHPAVPNTPNNEKTPRSTPAPASTMPAKSGPGMSYQKALPWKKRASSAISGPPNKQSRRWTPPHA